MICSNELRKMVPLTKAVNAAMIDAYEDVGRSKQLFTHWAARGLKVLYGHNLPKKTRRAILMINKNTNTATLPVDFDKETFVGIINSKGHKVPIPVNTAIAIHPDYMDYIPKQGDTCASCGQDRDICEELQTEEETEIVVFGTQSYELSSVKKLYPNGDYYLERNVPYMDTASGEVVYRMEKEFIEHFDRKSCGCLETTDDNIWKLQECASSVYTCYFASCDSSKDDYAGYKVFEDQNIIQFDKSVKFDKVYIEYNAFLQKSQGRYWIPEVAFETIVEWTKFKSIDGKRNVPMNEKDWRWKHYLNAKGNMTKELGKVNFSQLVQMIGMTPKFD